MQADKWLEVNLVGLVILGGLMFVTTKVMNLGTAVTDLQINLANTSERVDHLAQALPALAINVAQQQISRPLRTIVVAGNPERVGGRYRVMISIIDARTSQRWTAPLWLSSRTDVAPLAALAWSGYELDSQFASFARMLEYAHTASLDEVLPVEVDTSVSFVLGATSATDFLAAVSHLGFAPEPAAFGLKFSDWKELSQALKMHPEEFLAVPGASAAKSATATTGATGAKVVQPAKATKGGRAARPRRAAADNGAGGP